MWSLHSQLWQGASGTYAKTPLRLGLASNICRRHNALLSRTWSSAKRCRAQQLRCRASREMGEIDTDLQEAINEACNKCLRAMLANDEAAAAQVSRELLELQQYVLDEGEEQVFDIRETQAAHFLGVLRCLLRHTLPTGAGAQLEGGYQAAISRLCNQLSGSDWKLVEEGKEDAVPGSDEPRFSTWDEVLGGKKAGNQQRGQEQNGGGQGQSNLGRAGRPVDPSYYQLLGVPPSASPSEIKSAYRKLALKLHPDVNNAPDATERFAAVAQAYDTLSEETSRELYDQYGPEGMGRHAGAAAGRGNARRAWEEFKPHKRENKHTRARDAARASYGESFDESSSNASSRPGGSSGYSSGSSSEAGGGVEAGADCNAKLPVVGDVVEYPLGAVVRADLMDGRTHGVALLVGRNMDRGDASRLPPEALGLCEVEPLRQEEVGSNRWVADELSPPAFCHLGELRPVPVAAYDPRYDIWLITAPLSEGCGGPELPEEIMV